MNLASVVENQKKLRADYEVSEIVQEAVVEWGVEMEKRNVSMRAWLATLDVVDEDAPQSSKSPATGTEEYRHKKYLQILKRNIEIWDKHRAEKAAQPEHPFFDVLGNALNEWGGEMKKRKSKIETTTPAPDKRSRRAMIDKFMVLSSD